MHHHQPRGMSCSWDYSRADSDMRSVTVFRRCPTIWNTWVCSKHKMLTSPPREPGLGFLVLISAPASPLFCVSSLLGTVESLISKPDNWTVFYVDISQICVAWRKTSILTLTMEPRSRMLLLAFNLHGPMKTGRTKCDWDKHSEVTVDIY